MLNSVFVGEEGIIVGVPVPVGNATNTTNSVVLQRDYFLSADDACGYPEDFFESVSEAALEEMGAEYLSGKWVNVA